MLPTIPRVQRRQRPKELCIGQKECIAWSQRVCHKDKTNGGGECEIALRTVLMSLFRPLVFQQND